MLALERKLAGVHANLVEVVAVAEDEPLAAEFACDRRVQFAFLEQPLTSLAIFNLSCDTKLRKCIKDIRTE